jgi:uncharacterized HAD superfamily protein
MIYVPTIDAEICYKDRVIIDIIGEIVSGNPAIKLSMIGEGPCLTHIGLYSLLDSICEKFSFPKKQITICTANFLESHNEYIIVKEHQNYELRAFHQYPQSIENIKKINQDFRHFGYFVGHGNQYRLHLSSYLYSQQRKNTIQTFHCQVTEHYHRPHIGVEDMMFNCATHQEIDNAIDLLKNSPIKIDQIDSYPILVPKNLNIMKVYPSFFVEIVSLTYFSGNVFYVDEKVWRPIFMKTPFIIQGPTNTIKNLHKLGFRTFGNWWDEGYSEDPISCHIPAIINNIEQLAKLNTKEIQELYNNMLPTLEHNYNRLLELTPADFKQAFAV